MSVKNTIRKIRRLRAVRAHMMAAMRQDRPAEWTAEAARNAAALPGDFRTGTFTRFALDNAGALHYPPLARGAATPGYRLAEDESAYDPCAHPCARAPARPSW